MSLFLTPNHCVNLGLEASEEATFRGMPEYWGRPGLGNRFVAGTVNTSRPQQRTSIVYPPGARK